MSHQTPVILTQEGLQGLLALLAGEGYRVVGPTARDGALIYDDLESLDDLPRGWTDRQAAGEYRLARRDDEALFGYVVGPHSWKRFLHPPTQPLWHAERDTSGVQITPEPLPETRFAFIGVRACELHAIAIQDKVFMGSAHVDTHYRARRENAFLVAVNCGEAAPTCFCTSMGTGPRADAGFDLSLTEIGDADGFIYLTQAGTEAGARVLAKLSTRPATETEKNEAQATTERTAAMISRTLPTDGLPDLLKRNRASTHWDDVARRCLACGNCTMVCPTCFCTTVEDSNDLTLRKMSRTQTWDSCFTGDFSYIHGGTVRHSTASRYRQWLTHKLATWADQFGTSGCVGCGRCITWCPVGIDITQEVAAIRASEPQQGD